MQEKKKETVHIRTHGATVQKHVGGQEGNLSELIRSQMYFVRRCFLNTLVLCEVPEIAAPRYSGSHTLIFLLVQRFPLLLHHLGTHELQKDKQRKGVFEQMPWKYIFLYLVIS